MPRETIRKNLVDAINELTRLLEACDDTNRQFELRIKIRELFQQLDRVIVAILESGTPQFNDAVEALKTLTKEAKSAKAKIEMVGKVIDKAADAVKKVEKLIVGVKGVLPIL